MKKALSILCALSCCAVFAAFVICGEDNTAYGDDAGFNASGVANLAFGKAAAAHMRNSSSNALIGVGAGYNAFELSEGVAIGHHAAMDAVNCRRVVAIGEQSLKGEMDVEWQTRINDQLYITRFGMNVCGANGKMLFTILKDGTIVKPDTNYVRTVFVNAYAYLNTSLKGNGSFISPYNYIPSSFTESTRIILLSDIKLPKSYENLDLPVGSNVKIESRCGKHKVMFEPAESYATASKIVPPFHDHAELNFEGCTISGVSKRVQISDYYVFRQVNFINCDFVNMTVSCGESAEIFSMCVLRNCNINNSCVFTADEYVDNGTNGMHVFGECELTDSKINFSGSGMNLFASTFYRPVKNSYFKNLNVLRISRGGRIENCTLQFSSPLIDPSARNANSYVDFRGSLITGIAMPTNVVVRDIDDNGTTNQVDYAWVESGVEIGEDGRVLTDPYDIYGNGSGELRKIIRRVQRQGN